MPPLLGFLHPSPIKSVPRFGILGPGGLYPLSWVHCMNEGVYIYYEKVLPPRGWTEGQVIKWMIIKQFTLSDTTHSFSYAHSHMEFINPYTTQKNFTFTLMKLRFSEIMYIGRKRSNGVAIYYVLNTTISFITKLLFFQFYDTLYLGLRIAFRYILFF